MNLAQSLGVAAAAFVLGLTSNGGAGARLIAYNAIDSTGLRAAIEHVAVNVEASYALREVASRYATFLGAAATESADDGVVLPAPHTEALGADLDCVHAPLLAHA